MKVVSILILAVAAVYAYSDDGDYHNDEDYKQVNKQEKKECKSTDLGCFDFGAELALSDDDQPPTIYWPTDTAKIIPPPDACCSYCQSLPTSYPIFCLTIYQFNDNFGFDYWIDSPVFGCKCRKQIPTTPPRIRDTPPRFTGCLPGYGVAYYEPLGDGDFDNLIATEECFSINPPVIYKDGI